MTKWGLAELMGLYIEKDEYEERAYRSYVRAGYDDYRCDWIIADTLEEAQEKAAEEYFEHINYRTFSRR